MSSLFRYAIIFTAVVLSLFGTNRSGGVLFSQAAQHIDAKSTCYSFSEDRPNLYSVPRQSEILSAIGSGFSTASINDFTLYLWGHTPTIEHRVNRITAQYLYKSYHLYRSLAISDIIYPFHYFW
jgi:hypothetical protein